MENLFNDDFAEGLKSDLQLRVYTSNLLGQSSELVLHGGGNTSVKSSVDGEELLFVKGSGWDLVSIQAEGFTPVKMSTLLEMAELETLSDSDMVSGQKAAIVQIGDKSAPNPSVEAILHALIPYKFVDHTHADAIVTISNSENGERLIQELYPNFLIVPYVMPGFILAHTIYEMTKDVEFASLEGIILHNHGIFTFDNSAKKSYSKMIDAVTLAEEFLEKNAKVELLESQAKDVDMLFLKEALSIEKGYDVSLKLNSSDLAYTYASQDDLDSFATRGVLTPEHIIRTKRVPLILNSLDEIEVKLKSYKEAYSKYFETFCSDEVMLHPTPNYIILKNVGVISIAKSEKEANIIHDIVEHTMMAVLRADKLGGYKSISLNDSFEMEYWELEQAKLKK